MTDTILGSEQAALFAARGTDPSRAAHLMSLAPSSVHIDTALSNFLIAYKNRRFIADELLPVVAVNKRSDKIFAFPIETYQTLAKVALSNNRGRPSELSYSVNSTTNYSVADYGLIDFVSYDEEANADAPLQPRLAATQILTNALLLGREQRVANLVFGSSNYGSSTSALSGGNRWDTSTSTPVQDILTAIMNTFVGANALAIGEQAWVKLRGNADLKGYVVSRASTGLGPTPAIADEEFVAKAFGLDKVLIGRAKYNTANEGAAVTTDWLWGKSCSILRVEPQPNARMTETFGYTLRFGGTSIQNQVIPEQMLGVRGGNWIKLTHSDAEVSIGGGSAGYLYTTVIS